MGEDVALAHELAEVNRRRLRVLAPVMICVHVAHVVLFHVPAAARSGLSPDVARWRDALVWAHAVMLPFLLVVGAFVWRGRSERLARLAGPVVGAAYLLHGALCASLDQIVVTNVTAYLGYAMGLAVVLALTPLASSVAYAVGALAMTAGMLTFQTSAGARLSNLPNCATITVAGLVLSWLQFAGRKRDFTQRLTIDRQRDELAQLNAGLERRVQEQVHEIVAMNAQLQAQVRARSEELSVALARLAQARPNLQPLERGTLIADRFTVDEVIGEGGMGAVWAGTDRSTGGRVAIKVVQASSARQLEALRRFIREAGAAATVSHPAVVRMLHLDVSNDGLLFQVQELVEGQTLTRRLHQRWQAHEAARLGAVLCDALAAAHAQGVVHRDVKPDNMMLTMTTPGLKLLDFGIAKLHDAVRASEDTTAGVILGTPAYMAPEQVAGSVEISDRADVYAVGIVLFRLLTSRLPYQAETAQEMMMRHLMTPAPDARTVEPSVPEPLALLIARCLAKEPTVRPRADAVAAELRSWADGHAAPPLEQLLPFVAENTVATPRRRARTP